MKTMNVFDRLLWTPAFALKRRASRRVILTLQGISFPSLKFWLIRSKGVFYNKNVQKIAEIFNTLRFGVIMSGHHVRSNTFNSINGVSECRRRMSRAPLLKEFGNLSNKKLVVVRLSVNPPLHVNQKELWLFNDLVSRLEIGRVGRDWKGGFYSSRLWYWTSIWCLIDTLWKVCRNKYLLTSITRPYRRLILSLRLMFGLELVFFEVDCCLDTGFWLDRVLKQLRAAFLGFAKSMYYRLISIVIGRFCVGE